MYVKTRHFKEAAHIMKDQALVAEVFEKVIPVHVFIADDSIESVTPITLKGFLDSEMLQPLEYTYYRVKTKTSEVFEVDEINFFVKGEARYIFRSITK